MNKTDMYCTKHITSTSQVGAHSYLLLPSNMFYSLSNCQLSVVNFSGCRSQYFECTA